MVSEAGTATQPPIKSALTTSIRNSAPFQRESAPSQGKSPPSQPESAPSQRKSPPTQREFAPSRLVVDQGGHSAAALGARVDGGPEVEPDAVDRALEVVAH